jgi:hypothetical protein
MATYYGRKAALRICAACAAFGLCATATAQFCDNFDSYPAGGGLAGLGGWELWFSGGNDGTLTTAQANSTPNSFRYQIGTDVVQRFSITSGRWTATAMTYMPSNAGGTGFSDGYFIMLNQYQNFTSPTGTPENWSVQVRFSAVDAVVESQWDLNVTGLIYDQWVEFRAEIDLDTDWVELYYDGVLFAPGRLWTENNFSLGAGIPEIQAIDLWSDTNEGMFVDDVTLLPEGGSCPSACPGDLNGDGRTDLADLGILLADFGCAPPGPCVGDLNGDGFTDLADLGILLADFGCAP